MQKKNSAHSDYGTITLLFQDSVGGLEVQDPSTHQFTPAPPIDDVCHILFSLRFTPLGLKNSYFLRLKRNKTIVVNVGDLLSRWSNDLFKSTLHRVVLPQTSGPGPLTPRRQSVAFFTNPNAGTLVEALPGTGPPKYPPVQADAYLVKRLAATYS